MGNSEEPVKAKRKSRFIGEMNIKHRTLNIQHRIMYSVYFKKD